jgi:hypothetical protein
MFYMLYQKNDTPKYQRIYTTNYGTFTFAPITESSLTRYSNIKNTEKQPSDTIRLS